ncbi:sodium/potassium/calcium exchanger 3-like isoform X2 [Patiria miniata]|uniref:Sodium/calcium exchanger membrane region domain-containing protein n=1 Tax=Patiria miniata TaxID=46514 RepID=A0A914AUT0_PATMI|nr:sodium/potassium/calcium exchanger 3-like isoform X2 [Patiria miniata]
MKRAVGDQCTSHNRLASRPLFPDMSRFHRYRVWRAASVVHLYFSLSCLALVAALALLALGIEDLDYRLHGDIPDHRVSRRDTDGENAAASPLDLAAIHDKNVSPALDVNCTPPSIDNFPPNLMSWEVLRHGGFLINLAAVFYMFGILALVCDNYFMSSLEILCADLHLSEDVAGASFMAIGGSAPELFTSIFGVFIAKGNIGVGTVIGSAVFNILCVIGLCGVLAGQIVYLSRWPLARDFLWYVLTVIGLVLVIWDNVVHWWESMIFIIVYIAYLIFLYFDPPIKRYMESYSGCQTDHDREGDDVTSSDLTSSGAETTPIVVDQKLQTSSFGADDNDNSGKTAPDEKLQETEVNPLSPFLIPDGCCKRFLWFVGFPPSFLFYLTIPNCSLKRWRKWYPVTFVVALAWIGAVTYLLVWMVTILGYAFHVPDSVMGLTLVAAGSSTPDTILSVIAARNGYGDMAICHSIGSNIFDILLGLGLPWFLHSAAVQQGQPVPTYSDGLTIIAAMLLATVVVSLIIIKLSSFKLNKKIGVVLIVFYVAFLIPAILLEMNVLVKGLTLPQCPRKGE